MKLLKLFTERRLFSFSPERATSERRQPGRGGGGRWWMNAWVRRGEAGWGEAGLVG